MPAKATAALIQACTGAQEEKALGALPVLIEIIPLYGLTTLNRLGMFLANVGWETGGFRFLTELWGPTDVQRNYDYNESLGNVYLGDGFRFRGRGWFQTTGRANYLLLTNHLRTRWPEMQVPNFVSDPDLLGTQKWAAWGAGEYVTQRGLNAVADGGNFSNYCDFINRGHVMPRPGMSNGWAGRLRLWQAGEAALRAAGYGDTISPDIPSTNPPSLPPTPASSPRPSP